MTTTTDTTAPDPAEQETAPRESLRDLAAEAAALDLLAARVAEAKKDVRARLQAALDDAHKRDGVDRVAASLPSGETVATFSLRKGEVGPVVVDEDEFARWVRDTVGEEFTTVRIVREVKPWKAKELLDQMAALERTPGPDGPTPAQWPNPDTGEVVDVPGVLIKPTRARTHGITWRKSGKDAVVAAWRRGELSPLPALAPAPAEQDGDQQ